MDKKTFDTICMDCACRWLDVLNDVYEYLNNGTDGEFFGSND